MVWFLSILTSPQTVQAHNGVHSTTRLIFTDEEQVWPIVQSNWGFFHRKDEEWKWLCPDVLDTEDLYNLEVDEEKTWWFGTLDGLWKSHNQCDVAPFYCKGGLDVTRLEYFVE